MDINLSFVKTIGFKSHQCMLPIDFPVRQFPGDSDHTPACSICLKFAGPKIRTKRQLLVRLFLESRIQRTSTRKSKLKPLNTRVCTVHRLFSF